MANYNGMSHYSHEIDEKYIEGWNSIFGKKKNPGVVNDQYKKASTEADKKSSSVEARK